VNRSRTTRLLAGVALSASLAVPLLTAGPAYASSSSGQSQEASQYSSLAGGLLALYAAKSHETLAEYLSTQQVLLVPQTASIPTVPAGAVPALTPQALPSMGALPTTLPSAEVGGSAAPTPAVSTPAADVPTSGATPTLTPAAGTSPDGVPGTSGTEPAAPLAAPTLSLSGLPGLPTLTANGGSVTAPKLNLGSLPSLGTKSELGSVKGATPVTANTVAELNTKLGSAGLTLNDSSYTSLAALAAQVTAKENTPDGAVTLAGAQWTANLANLHEAGLSTPTVGKVSSPTIPQGALVYGLLMDKSLTAMVNSHANLLTTVGSTGLGSPALSKAWTSSMASAYTDSTASLASVLPDACTGAMLAVTATGKASSGDSYGNCSSSCVTGGEYLHNQLGSLFTPQAGASTVWGDPFSNLWNTGNIDGLQGWQQQDLLSQNPNLVNQLNSNEKVPDSASCAAASTGTSSVLSSALPGIFSSLSQ
jgi:hypothetical protein